MPASILFFNRYSQRLEAEAVYGENFLRWAYENPLGRAATWLLVKRALFSRWYGWRMNRPASRAKIAPFIAQYEVDVSEMAADPATFPHFNAFFSRRLKLGARPVVAPEAAVAFPADGRHLVIPDLAASEGFFVKGIRFDAAALLGDAELAGKYKHGSALISRLCPVDYHRFHFPVSGRPRTPRLINGPLFSVNPIALRRRPTLLWENKRYLTRMTTEEMGEVLLLEVGATCVGTVVHTHPAGELAHKGGEKGYFLFGASCFITLFEPDRVRFTDDLLTHSKDGREVYARMGDRCAEVAGSTHVDHGT